MTDKQERVPLDNAKEPAPAEEILQWCEHLVRAIADHGTWAIPRSGVVFTVDRANKTLWLVKGPDNINLLRDEFLTNKNVFAHIGWHVKVSDKLDKAQAKALWLDNYRETSRGGDPFAPSDN